MKRWLWAFLVGGALVAVAGCGHDHVYRPTVQAPADTCDTDHDDD